MKRKPVKKKKTIRKKVASKTKKAKKRSKQLTIKSTKGRCKMAGRKKRKNAKRSTRKRVTRRRYSGMSGKMNMGNITAMLTEGGLNVAGAIGGSVLANMIPIADPRIKASLPLVAGIVLGMSPFSKQAMFKPIISGMIVAGGLSLVKQFAPNIPMLAGEYEDDYEQIPEEIEGDAITLLGQESESDDFSELLGESVDISGEDFITSADI